VALRRKTGVAGLVSRWGSWKFLNYLILLSALSSPGVHSASNTNEFQRDFFGSKMEPARRAGNFAVRVVLNVKATMEAKYSIPLLSLHDLLRESVTFYLYTLSFVVFW
jgi:hypothetical protein